MVNMIVFDMAGTTVDEDNVVYKTLRKSINEEGFNVSIKQVLKIGAGKEKYQAIKDIMAVEYPATDDYIIDDIFTAFEDELRIAYKKLDIKPQKGAKDLFENLREKNIKVVLNTGYNTKTANDILNKLHWTIGKEIDALITAEDVESNRPHPDMIFLAMQKFNITNAKEVIKVGDSIVDIEEGKNAGCLMSIGITTGAHTYEQLAQANPSHIINNLMEIMQFI